MRTCVLSVWGRDHVVAGVDPWVVVDEAWASMAESGFRCAGPFLPFALRVARNKALDARGRAEARRRDLSLHGGGFPASGGEEPRVLADTTVGSLGADVEFFSTVEHLQAIRRLALAEEAIYGVLSDEERSAFLAVRVAGKSRAAVGRDLDPPVTGQRVGQVIAAATMKIRAYVQDSEPTMGEP